MADYHFPGEHMYEDMVLEGLMSDKALDIIKTMPILDGDVIVATYPKTGTTWMQEITWMVQNDCDMDKALSEPVMSRMKFLEFENTCYNGVSGVEAILPRTEPCIMKTHLPARFLVNQINEGKLKVILVARNPKDTLVSLYHFYRMNDGLGNFSGSFDDFFELFKTKHMLLGDFFNWYASWIRYLGRKNVELFTYEGMKNDAPGTIDRVSNFLGKTTPGDKKAVILNHTAFKSMKANKMTNASLLLPELNEKTSSFMRKGQVADWKNYFNQEQSDYVDKRYEETLKGKGYELIFE